MKVTIAVPNYNHGHFLRACLESIRIQHHKDFEVFVQDNLSTDNSAEIAQEYVNKDPRFHLTVAKVRTISAAAGINEAMAKGTGEIGVWLNSDDEFQEWYLSTLVPYFQDPTIGFVRTSIVARWDDGDFRTFNPEPWGELKEIMEINQVFPESPFRRQLFLDVGGLDDTVRYWDWDFWIRCAHAVKEGKFHYKTCMKPVVVRRIHGYEPWYEEGEKVFTQLGQPRGEEALKHGATYIRNKYKERKLW